MIIENRFYALRAANEQRQKEWDPYNKITHTFRTIELGGELGEALNVIKKLEREHMGIGGSRATMQDLEDELADIIICTDLLAMSYGINLWRAVVNKFNTVSVRQKLKTSLFEDGEVLPK